MHMPVIQDPNWLISSTKQFKSKYSISIWSEEMVNFNEVDSNCQFDWIKSGLHMYRNLTNHQIDLKVSNLNWIFNFMDSLDQNAFQSGL